MGLSSVDIGDDVRNVKIDHDYLKFEQCTWAKLTWRPLNADYYCRSVYLRIRDVKMFGRDEGLCQGVFQGRILDTHLEVMRISPSSPPPQKKNLRVDGRSGGWFVQCTFRRQIRTSGPDFLHTMTYCMVREMKRNFNKYFSCEFWGFHGGIFQVEFLWVVTLCKCCGRISTFQRSMLPAQHLHGVTTQNTSTWNVHLAALSVTNPQWMVV
jgi:hypothetical protein